MAASAAENSFNAMEVEEEVKESKQLTSLGAAAAAAATSADDDVKGLDDDLDNSTMEFVVGEKNVKVYHLNKKWMKLSVLVKTALENDPNAESMSLAKIDPEVFDVILPYIEHRKGEPAPIIEAPAKSKKMSENCDSEHQWEAKFSDDMWEADRAMTYKSIQGANYLDIKCLLHLLCCKVGTLIKDTPYDKIHDVISPDVKPSTAPQPSTATAIEVDN